MITRKNNSLVRMFNGEIMQVDAFGPNSLRVRITHLNEMQDEDWALIKQEEIESIIEISNPEKASETQVTNSTVLHRSGTGSITNGKIKFEINRQGKFRITNQKGKVLIDEYDYEVYTSLGIVTRELKSMPGGLFKASLKLKSDPEEKLYGMGQYQNGIFNLKGSVLELAQRNSQASIPFLFSNLGYGFLWNNPAVGNASFGTNMTKWESDCTKQIDFWITAGDTPEEIVQTYTDVTGKTPVMPEYAMGFWQCKLRYQTQEELLEVARNYKRFGVPLSVIVIDFFHWTYEGDWSFDKTYWPDPKAMVDELKEMGVEVVVSIWPTVSINSENYAEMKDLGYFIRSENGIKVNMFAFDLTSFADCTNPEARKYMWNKAKENYYKYGIRCFWLDEAEPEYTSYDFDNYRYYKGLASEVGNEYPKQYTRAFYEGLVEEGEKDSIISLVRCAWAGSQKYGALLWSGDIPSTFDCFKNQIVCGLQTSIAGISWWTTDIGGFHDGDVNDPKFKELLIRWFQYGAFCPVMRLHGHRDPKKQPMSNFGGGRCGSGADNEIWSFGNENYEIMKKYIELRERLKPYIKETAKACTEKGSPIMRPLYYDFPQDENVWEIKNQFMFGKDILVAPVTEYLARTREVYLPKGESWIDTNSKKVFEGGQKITCDAGIETMPVFVRKSREDLVSLF